MSYAIDALMRQAEDSERCESALREDLAAAEQEAARLAAVAGSWQARAEAMEAALASACEREAALRAIVDGRTVPPTDEEIAAHWRAGGTWLHQGVVVLRGVEETQRAASEHRRMGMALRWVAVLDGRPTAWPVVAAVSRAGGASE